MRTKLSGLLSAAVAIAALGLLGAPTAQAVPPAVSPSAGHTATISVPAGENSGAVTMNGATVTVVRSAHPSVAVLTCSVSVGTPYHGTAGVSSVVWAHCNSNAATLSFGTALYYDRALASQNNTSLHNCTNCYVTVTAPYQPGQWRAGAILGYFDSTGNGQFTDESYSSTVTL